MCYVSPVWYTGRFMGFYVNGEQIAAEERANQV